MATSQTSESSEASKVQTVLIGTEPVGVQKLANGNVQLSFTVELEPKYKTAKGKAMLLHLGGSIPIPVPGVVSSTIGLNIVGVPDGSYQLPDKELRDRARKMGLPIVFDPDTNGLKLGNAGDEPIAFNLAKRAADIALTDRELNG